MLDAAALYLDALFTRELGEPSTKLASVDSISGVELVVRLEHVEGDSSRFVQTVVRGVFLEHIEQLLRFLRAEADSGLREREPLLERVVRPRDVGAKGGLAGVVLFCLFPKLLQ